MEEKKIEELRAKIESEIESIQDFIEVANKKLDKLSGMIVSGYIYGGGNKAAKRTGLRELCSEYCRISNLIDEAKVDIEDYKIQLERLERLKEDKKPETPHCYIVIEI